MRAILAVAAWLMVVAAAGAVDAQSGPRFVLSGVVVVEGGGRAWLQEPSLTRNQVVAVRLGETVGPYRLTKILDDRVELAGPEGSFAVLLAGAQGPAQGPATVTAPPARPVRESTPTNDPNDPNRVVILPPGPPLAPLPEGTPRVDFGSLLRGGIAPGK